MKKNKPYVDKANNTSPGVSFARQRFKAYFQFSMIAIAFVVVFGIIYYIAIRKDLKNNVDYSAAQLIQYQLPADDAPVVVYETDKGTFKALLFPEQTPEYYKYFTGLVESGYYDGTHVFAVQDEVYFMGGSKTADGTDDDNTDKNELDPEKHRDLWPFYGAIAGYGNRKSMFSSAIGAGSRDLFIGSIEFTDELKEQLDSVSDNTKLNDAFKTRGGVPNFSQQYTIFAQVYDGFDAYEGILTAEVVDPSDGDDDKSVDLAPKGGITFKKVYISTYGENRCDEFFTASDSPDGEQ